MKVAASVIAICMTLLLLGPGCSNEEQSMYSEYEPGDDKTIKRPIPKTAKAVPHVPEARPAKETKDVVGIKTAAVEEKEPKRDEKKVVKERKEDVREEKGYYIVKEGESLSRIAGREDVYGDPLKWPILYRLNTGKLAKIEKADNPHEKELSKGMKLKLVSPDEVKKNLMKRSNNVWVVNVLSSTTKSKIVPNVIKLIKNGYPAYITRTEVKGKEWMRLRVGFYKDRKSANTAGTEIKRVLSLADIWATKVGKNEFRECGGY
ncbi:MAG: SPOR domain-containing protein [Deltaproteobacteria bacterium]|nr:SPOR domain-containing protein [Deltaproteobacteria bacterium]